MRSRGDLALRFDRRGWIGSRTHCGRFLEAPATGFEDRETHRDLTTPVCSVSFAVNYYILCPVCLVDNLVLYETGGLTLENKTALSLGGQQGRDRMLSGARCSYHREFLQASGVHSFAGLSLARL